MARDSHYAGASPNAVDRVQRGALIETVVATGNVEMPFRVIIGSQITGTVQEVDVAEGQRVTAGQRLNSLGFAETERGRGSGSGRRRRPRRMHQLDELTLPTARDTLRQAQSALLNYQQIFDRASALAWAGYETRVVLDAAQKDIASSNTPGA